MNNVILESLLEASARGTFLILLALALAPVVRRWFGPNGAHWLWCAALIALLWPQPPRSPFSIQNLWKPGKADLTKEASVPVPNAIKPEMKVQVRHVPAPGAITPAHAIEPPSFIEPKIPVPPSWRMTEPGTMLVSLWLVGVAVSLARMAWRWRRTMCLVRSARAVSRNLWASSMLKLGIKVPPDLSLAETSQLRAPALAGILRPRVLIPEGWLQHASPAELESVLLHELGHHSRRDLVWEWLFALARCLHWFNPFVWMAENLVRHERELACDAWALDRAESPNRYGRALLDALQRAQLGGRNAFGAVAMAADARQITLRLRKIAQYRRTPRLLAWIGAVPALLLLAIIGTGPLSAEPEAQSSAAQAAGQQPAASDSSTQSLPAATPSPPTIAIPLSDRTVELSTNLLRVPEWVAQRYSLPIAEEGTAGISRVYSSGEYQGLLKNLEASPGVEILETPHLVGRNGSLMTVEIVNEFRFGDRYKKSKGDPDLLIPESIEQIWLGLTLQAQATFESEDLVDVRFTPALTRLLGLKNPAGTVTEILPCPPGMDWFQRLSAWRLPAGAAGEPEILQQVGAAQLSLAKDQTAVVFGFRDAEKASPGASGETTTMVNYIVLKPYMLQ